MSKKVKRQVNRSVPAAPAAAPRSLGATEFAPDYSHVKKDLLRIGLLAGTFFVILIVIAIFQDQVLALFVK